MPWGRQWAPEAYLPVNEDWRPVCEYYVGMKVRKNLLNYE